MSSWFDQILFHARAQPQAHAMAMEDRAITYGMLDAGIESCARRIGLTFRSGAAPVAVVVDNPIRHVTLCLALLRVGISSISLKPSQYALVQTPMAGTLGDAVAKTSLRDASGFVEVTDDWFAPAAGVEPTRHGALDSRQICRLSLTSGSTGLPKILSFTLEDIGRRGDGLLTLPWSRLLNLPGLSSAWGFWTACATLAAGKTVYFSGSPFQAVRMLERFSIEYVMAATEQLVALTRVAMKVPADLSSLRMVEVAGAPPTKALLKAAMQHLSRNIYCRYGASEAGAIARASASEVLERPGLAGKALPGLEVAVLDAHGQTLADGKPGRLMVRAQSGGTWVDLGDIGCKTAEGDIFLLGRAVNAAATPNKDNALLAQEAEHLLRLEWDAADAGAVVMQDGPPAQVWVGTVECLEADAGKLQAILAGRGMDCRVRILPLQGIPRGPSGKINRVALQAALLAAAGR